MAYGLKASSCDPLRWELTINQNGVEDLSQITWEQAGWKIKKKIKNKKKKKMAPTVIFIS